MAESSLFVFATGVLGRKYLTRSLHRPVCDWLIDFRRRRRKLLMLPREHCKTTIGAHALPLHMLIQPAATNPYCPGQEGSEATILLAGETEDRAKDAIRVMQTALETNPILRGLWPHRVWHGSPRALSKKWNDTEMIWPRAQEYPDPSVRGVGVGAAITGMHPRVLIKDDLATFAAQASPALMKNAIAWHVTSRALINHPDSLEFNLTTRWAPYDWARYIEEEEQDSVEVYKRAGIEEGRPIYPEAGFTLEKFDALRKEFGLFFPLLYLNTAVDAALTDFDMTQVRRFMIQDGAIQFSEDERDVSLAERVGAVATPSSSAPARSQPGLPARDTSEGGRDGYFRLKYG